MHISQVALQRRIRINHAATAEGIHSIYGLNTGLYRVGGGQANISALLDADPFASLSSQPSLFNGLVVESTGAT